MSFIKNFIEPVEGFDPSYELNKEDKKNISDASEKLKKCLDESAGNDNELEELKFVKIASTRLEVKTSDMKDMIESIKSKLDSYKVFNPVIIKISNP